MHKKQITQKIDDLRTYAPDVADELGEQYKRLVLDGPYSCSELEDLVFTEDDIADNNFSINSSEHDLVRDIQHYIVSFLAIDN